MVFGFYINQSLLRQNNITDMNIYFYDPINAVRFIPSKVTNRSFEGLIGSVCLTLYAELCMFHG